MLALPDLAKLFGGLHSSLLEDVADRFNFYISILVILFFSIITGSKQHFGQPITCMAPPESPDSWVAFFHDYCYVNDKITFHDNLPFSSRGAKQYGKARIVYYQWVPYLLLTQLVCFYIPKSLWLSLSHNFGNGIDMESVVSSAVSIRSLYGEDRKAKLNLLARFLNSSKERRSGILGSRIDSLFYVLMKWLSTLNTFIQLHLMCWFIADGRFTWAFELLRDLFHGGKTHSAYGFFPRVTFCDLQKEEMAQTHSYTFQCVLMFNFVNEKIFLFLFIWILFLFMLNLVVAMRQTLHIVSTSFRFFTAKRILPTKQILFRDISWSPANSKALISYFIHTSLHCDGLFLLEAVSTHAGRLIARELASELFAMTVKKTESWTDSLEYKDIPPPKILRRECDDEVALLTPDGIPHDKTTLDRKFSRSSPDIFASAPPYDSLFTNSGREKPL